MGEREEVLLQRRYYAGAAADYDKLHVGHRGVDEEHDFALAIMGGLINLLGAGSVLDVGAGTGRTLLFLNEYFPAVRAAGVEPVAELREQGYRKGIGPDALVDGDGEALGYGDGSFDIVCEYGVLHHVPRPDRVVSEMLRVARKAVFVSDSNNMGQGSPLGRLIKQSFRAVGLWPLIKFVKTRGKGYHVSEGDGVFYPYSVFDNYQQISSACKSVHIFGTTPAGINPYRTAPCVAVLGVK